jgi:hypothetical protein
MKIAGMRAPRLRAPPGHDGADYRFLMGKLIRRGGAPSGAAASIAIGDMRVSTPIVILKGLDFQKEILFSTVR